MEIVESSHDTFDSGKFKNWLVNAAGVGVFIHGRIHQQSENLIYVGDIIHKRGHKKTDDLLLMEEQALKSCGEPLSINSKRGNLLALAVLPTMNTANGEGQLIAYYQNGVAAFDTAQAPRESRYDGNGTAVSQGWDTKRLVNYLLNTVSAVGRYAVAVLPRDHFFRSKFGLHLLKLTLGEASLNSEQINTVSQDVEPLLKADDKHLLRGAAAGYWVEGHRMFCTTGMIHSLDIAAVSAGRGFVSWNQATTFTEDRTPIPGWEGLWTVDNGIAGIHCFQDVGDGNFGFVCSGHDKQLYFASINPDAKMDHRDGMSLPIEASFETGVYAPDGLSKVKALTEGRIAGIFSEKSSRVRVLLRTDLATEWKKWHEFSPCGKEKTPVQSFYKSEPLGQPPQGYRHGTWFQIRVECIGHAEINVIDLDVSSDTTQSGRQQCVVVGASERDPFEINSTLLSERWPLHSD